MPTLWEYLQGGDPSTDDGLQDGGATLLTIVEDGGETFMEVSYRRLEALPPEIVVSVSYSEDLMTWSDEYVVEGAAPAPEVSVTEGSAESGTRLVHVRLTAPIGMDPRFAVQKL